MRQRLMILLMVLVVMMGTIVVASGILASPPPLEAFEAEEPPERASRASDPNAHIPAQVPKYRPTSTPRAPRAVDQDPQRIPDHEPPAPVLPDIRGGTAFVDVPFSLGREFELLPGREKGPSAATTHRVSIEVEKGLPIRIEEFSEFIMSTLNDERSWAGDGRVSFERTDSDPSIRIVLASPATVDAMCAPLATNGRWSCGTAGRAMLNADRWINGAEAFLAAGGDLEGYRTYLINHEVGHLLGHSHESCPRPGAVAPVMVQQSISVQGCVPNGWVDP